MMTNDSLIAFIPLLVILFFLIGLGVGYKLTVRRFSVSGRIAEHIAWIMDYEELDKSSKDPMAMGYNLGKSTLAGMFLERFN